MSKEDVWVPEVLKSGSKGEIKVWLFLQLNQHKWFTCREISAYLNIPVRTLQKILKSLREDPKIVWKKAKAARPGRKEILYKYSEREYGFY